MTGRRLSDAERKAIITAAGNKVSEADIIRLTGRSRGAVRRVLASSDIPRSDRSKSVDPATVKDLYEKQRKSVREVARALGVSYGTAHRAISEHCRMRPQGKGTHGSCAHTDEEDDRNTNET